jgi:hypothetical protein
MRTHSSRIIAKKARIRILGLYGVVFACAGACSWEEDGPSPPAFVEVQILDASAQPTTTDLGVLVQVSAWGGSVVHLQVVGGTLDSVGSVECLNWNPGMTTQVVSVHPTSTEAVLTARIGDLAPPSPEAVSDATLAITEGGIADSSVDARAETKHDGGADARAMTLRDGGSETGEAGDDGGEDGGVEGELTLLEAGPPLQCGANTFIASGQPSTIVVSLGRAPMPEAAGPPPTDSAAESATDSSADAPVDSPTDANAPDDASTPDAPTSDASGDDASEASTDASGGDAS